MAIRDQQREVVAGRLAAHLLDTGLTQTSLRQLAKAAGVSDRMLLYYFTDKAEVLSAATTLVAAQSLAGLAGAIPEATRLPPRQMILLAVQLTAGPQMRRFMRLWVEMIAAAAKGEEPFVTISAQVMAGFRQWLAERLDVPAGTDPGAMAAVIIALIDGLALVDICSSEAEMQAAHDALTVLLDGTYTKTNRGSH